MKHLIKALLLSFIKILWAYFAWMNKYSKHPEKTPLDVRYKKASKLISSVLKKLDVDINVMGKENIPNETCCFLSNHLNAADPLPFFSVMDKPTAFIGKVEVKKIPFVGKVFSSTDGLFVERGNVKQSVKVMEQMKLKLMNKETNFFVFPEGTRNRDNLRNLLPFRTGSIRSIMEAKVPIVPIAQYGSFRFLSTKFKAKRHTTYIKILSPIYPDEYSKMSPEELANKVQDMIQKEISFTLRKLDHENMVKTKAKGYNPYLIY